MLASYLAKRYKWNVTGIDLDPEQIERAKSDNVENEYLKFFVADVTNLPFENREFNMVLSFDVLHHIPNWDKALNEICRVLRPEGFYILNDIYHLKENNFEIVCEEKPKINIFLRHFSEVSQKNPINFC